MLVKQALGPEGISYVARYLEANSELGKESGQLLLQRFDLGDGLAWAFVPDPLPPERYAPLTAFETGGLYHPHADPWRLEVTKWVRKRVDGEPHLLCVEDALALPSDPWLKKAPGRYFFCGDSVFEWPRLTDDEDLAESLGEATWDPRVAILALRPPLTPRDRRTRQPI